MPLPCFVHTPVLPLRGPSRPILRCTSSSSSSPSRAARVPMPARRARVQCAADAADAADAENNAVDVLDGEVDAARVDVAEADGPVPGKDEMDELEEMRQRKDLEQFSAELRRERLLEEREAARLFGWVPYAETLNGRLAMFFILTGLLTEYWTGYNIPAQVELMARTLGIL